MPNNCSSIVKKVSITLCFILLASCAGINNYNNSAVYKGKVVVNSLNYDQLSFNILLTSNENNTIIQIHKPFYGNLLQIKYDNSSNLMKYISKDGSYEINADIPRNIGDIVNNCLLRESYVNEIFEDGQSLNIECYKNMDKTNFYQTLDQHLLRSFL